MAPPKQQSLFGEDLSPTQLLTKAIRSRPSAEIRSGHTWHIGNTYEIDENGIYFALGRTTRTTIEKYDEEARDFTEEAFETAPYTNVVADLRAEVVAIGAKSRLSPTIRGIGRQLEKLLNSAPVVQGRNSDIKVLPLQDPSSFLELLHDAYVIESLSVTFGLPNPWDVNEDFQKPLQQTLRKANGSSGSAVLEGQQLDHSVIEEIARSTASTGDDAKARIRPTEGESPVTIQLKGNPVIVDGESSLDDGALRDLLRRMRGVYLRLRRGQGDIRE